MTEIWFYHLQNCSADQILLGLLEKTLKRRWRAVVQFGSIERVDALNRFLWTWREDHFLPHGAKADGFEDMQPVFLTDGFDNPNGAQVRLCLEGVDPLEAIAQADTPYERVIVLFDGDDAEALDAARQQWVCLKSKPYKRSYWQMEHGKWQKKA